MLMNDKSPNLKSSMEDRGGDSKTINERVKKNLANRFLTKGERAAEIVYAVLQIFKPCLKEGFKSMKRELR